MWTLMAYIRQQIGKLGGEELYKHYGQQMLNSIVNKCTDNFGTEIVRYPEDEEISEVIMHFRQLNR